MCERAERADVFDVRFRGASQRRRWAFHKSESGPLKPPTGVVTSPDVCNANVTQQRYKSVSATAQHCNDGDSHGR